MKSGKTFNRERPKRIYDRTIKIKTINHTHTASTENNIESGQ